MVIGVPKEVKDHETRVGLVPSGVIHLHEAFQALHVPVHDRAMKPAEVRRSDRQTRYNVAQIVGEIADPIRRQSLRIQTVARRFRGGSHESSDSPSDGRPSTQTFPSSTF